jgi:TatD DNase family protein
MLIDSHCHLDTFADAELPDVIARAREAGVERMATIGIRGSQTPAIQALTARFPEVWGVVGVHPQQAGEAELPSVAELLAWADHPKIIGLGESGLDYFYDNAPHDLQREGFRRHIKAAQISGLPLVIHARDADRDIQTMLEDEHRFGGPFPFVLHCFSSGRPLAEAAVRLGGYVSFSGILTFRNSEAIRAVAADLPMDRLLLETDSPYLAPVPLRGKRCEPAFVAHTAKALGAVRGTGTAEIEAATTENFLRLFTKAAL